MMNLKPEIECSHTWLRKSAGWQLTTYACQNGVILTTVSVQSILQDYELPREFEAEIESQTESVAIRIAESLLKSPTAEKREAV